MIGVGDYVVHKTKKEEWGVGKVIDLGGTKKAPRITIFFTKTGGGKTFATLAPFVKVDEKDISEADIIQLDNISNPNRDNSNTYLDISDAIIGFKKILEVDDFTGERYLLTERDYKVEMHNKAVELFNEKDLRHLLEGEDYEELMARLKKFYAVQTNLLSHFEYMKLKDTLIESKINQKIFFEALLNLLHGDDFNEDFRHWVDTLDEMKQAKWPLATIFLYAVYPDKYMFVKPETIQVAADISNFYIGYDSKPTLDIYNRIMNFSHYLRMKISELKPKDMIDVQSFMWLMNPKTVELVTKYKQEDPDYWKQ